MRNRGFIVGLVTLAMLLAGGLIACSDDDNPTGTGNGGLGESDEGTANALAFELALPLMRALNMGPFLDQLPQSGSLIPAQCDPLDVCASGSAEICLGLGTMSITFTDCSAAGRNIDGTVTIEGTPSQGAGLMSLTIGEFTLSGDISYTYSSVDDCFEQFFSNVTLAFGDLEMTLGGVISYCPPAVDGDGIVYPNFAQILILIPSLDRTVEVVVFSDPDPGTLSVLIKNLNQSQILLICDGALNPPSLSCSAGPD